MLAHNWRYHFWLFKIILCIVYCWGCGSRHPGVPSTVLSDVAITNRWNVDHHIIVSVFQSFGWSILCHAAGRPRGRCHQSWTTRWTFIHLASIVWMGTSLFSGQGDDTRHWPPLMGTESTYFMSVNRNKKVHTSHTGSIIEELYGESCTLIVCPPEYCSGFEGKRRARDYQEGDDTVRQLCMYELFPLAF